MMENDVPARLQDYALHVAEKAARQAYNEASRAAATQVNREVRKALQDTCDAMVAKAQRSMEGTKAVILQDFYVKAISAETNEILASLQEVVGALGEVTKTLASLAQEFASARPAPPRQVRRTIERDENGRMVALVEEPN
jgi:hypothetical protein